MNNPDVIILGGGPNGLATALALGGSVLPHPLEVLVLDVRDPKIVPEDSRGTALTRSTQAMFQALGVWSELGPYATEMRDVLVTDGDGGHQALRPLLSFVTEPGQAVAASMVENCHLSRCLLAAVEKSPAISLVGDFAFADFQVTTSHITVTAKNEVRYSAPLLIAADGRNSAVRQQLGTKVTLHDYGQTALSFAITHSLPHHHVAEEHFSSKGVFAVLPLQGERASIVWGTSPAEARDLMTLDDDRFNATLQEKMGDRLGHVMVSGRRASYPLVMQIAESFVGPRIALLGDAAHAIHPLAGLGLNLGFKDAAALADVVVQAVRRGEDHGGPRLLDHYQMARRFDTLLTSLAMDGMNAVFVNDHPVLKPLRHMGLQLVDRLPGTKTFLMQQAAGVSQNTARLMQGLLPG